MYRIAKIFHEKLLQNELGFLTTRTVISESSEKSWFYAQNASNLPAVFHLVSSSSFRDYFSEKMIPVNEIPSFLMAFEHISVYVHDRTKWDLGRATSDVTS